VSGITIEVPIRVRYADTDRMGVVYYGTYPTYFEIARTEYMRQRGFTYRRLEEEGYFLVVVEMVVKYYDTATYDDLLIVRTSLSELRSRALSFDYMIMKGGRCIAEGKTYHVCVNREKRVVQLPPHFLGILRDGRA